ncbi:uncharacterized protein STEHIDRAFT_161384 [Stereum hirsutum FP-91666 SS1]|uniref:uncharacterized protein n=1 Tax=Stereum hirsutum (strain FP-91666) TaxID=721885 RepID=UPI000444A875|nr:uncharacterized protein STEHIDRAFT_161384 [Stereum hirsutum FP-91666 SS1]EIM82032.1 hypothetical protein STEHIDRAFT_161384 [Stereum hirsutum FP-91666 SS1]
MRGNAMTEAGNGRHAHASASLRRVLPCLFPARRRHLTPLTEDVGPPHLLPLVPQFLHFNKALISFSNVGDTDSLTKTWKVCTKDRIVDANNAKSKRKFKKLSKHMSDKLDKEKGRSIEELEAPGFKRNHSTDIICQHAAEKEHTWEVDQYTRPGNIKRMQFTFSLDQPTPVSSPPPQSRNPTSSHANDKDPPLTQRCRKPSATADAGQPDTDDYDASLRLNCGAMHTPLWRREPIDWLNCNACGLYSSALEVHRNNHGERSQKAPRPKLNEVIAECYNCNTTATPCGGGMTRARLSATRESFVSAYGNIRSSLGDYSDCFAASLFVFAFDPFSFVILRIFSFQSAANADSPSSCFPVLVGLSLASQNSFKLHGSPRPISMKSHDILKHSWHEARRASVSEWQSPRYAPASPGTSRCTSPTSAHDGTNNSNSLSPILTPDSTTQMNVGPFGGEMGDTYRDVYADYVDYSRHGAHHNQGHSSELVGVLGGGQGDSGAIYGSTESDGGFQHALNLSLGGSGRPGSAGFPGPYLPDCISQMLSFGDTYNGNGGKNSDVDSDALMRRSHKCRRMNNDSATDPPSSTISYSSFRGSFSSSTFTSVTSQSHCNLMNFAFSSHS